MKDHGASDEELAHAAYEWHEECQVWALAPQNDHQNDVEEN